MAGPATATPSQLAKDAESKARHSALLYPPRIECEKYRRQRKSCVPRELNSVPPRGSRALEPLGHTRTRRARGAAAGGLRAGRPRAGPPAHPVYIGGASGTGKGRARPEPTNPVRRNTRSPDARLDDASHHGETGERRHVGENGADAQATRRALARTRGPAGDGSGQTKGGTQQPDTRQGAMGPAPPPN